MNAFSPGWSKFIYFIYIYLLDAYNTLSGPGKTFLIENHLTNAPGEASYCRTGWPEGANITEREPEIMYFTLDLAAFEL